MGWAVNACPILPLQAQAQGRARGPQRGTVKVPAAWGPTPLHAAGAALRRAGGSQQSKSTRSMRPPERGAPQRLHQPVAGDAQLVWEVPLVQRQQGARVVGQRGVGSTQAVLRRTGRQGWAGVCMCACACMCAYMWTVLASGAALPGSPVPEKMKKKKKRSSPAAPPHLGGQQAQQARELAQQHVAQGRQASVVADCAHEERCAAGEGAVSV